MYSYNKHTQMRKMTSFTSYSKNRLASYPILPEIIELVHFLKSCAGSHFIFVDYVSWIPWYLSFLNHEFPHICVKKFSGFFQIIKSLDRNWESNKWCYGWNLTSWGNVFLNSLKHLKMNVIEIAGINYFQYLGTWFGCHLR